MYCTKCGAQIEANAAVCPSCGGAVNKTNMPNASDNAVRFDANTAPDKNEISEYTAPQTDNQAGSPVQNAYSAPPQGQVVSVGRWIGRMFFTWIPLVGGLVYFIMLVIWACTDKFEASSKNWAIASLIMIAINIAAGILIVWLIFALCSGSLDMLIRSLLSY